jgi:hypothetical protein
MGQPQVAEVIPNNREYKSKKAKLENDNDNLMRAIMQTYLQEI